MPDDAIKTTVIQHALESEENIEVACLIRANFEDVCKTAISPFLHQLENQLRTSLGQAWTLSNGLMDDLKDEFRAFKPDWADPSDPSRPRCAIVLSQRGEKGSYYVAWEKYAPIVQFTPELDLKLRTELEKRGYALKYSRGWGLWWMAKKYSRWDENAPQDLIDMYRGSDAVNYFKEHIQRWADTVAPEVDKSLQDDTL